MSEVLLLYRGRAVTEADAAFLRVFIAQHPGLDRRQLSVKVCQAWGWFQANGHPRGMVCRGLMLALHRAGHIVLPEKRRSSPNNAIQHRRAAEAAPCDSSPIRGCLSSLGLLEIRLVPRGPPARARNQIQSRRPGIDQGVLGVSIG